MVLGLRFSDAAIARKSDARRLRVAGTAVVGGLAVSMYASRRAIRQAVLVSRERERDQQLLVHAQLGQALSEAHDAINAVEAEVRLVLAATAMPTRAQDAAVAALAAVERIAMLLRASQPAREALADEVGGVPLLGSHVAHLTRAGDGPLMRRYGSRRNTPGILPEDLHGISRQVGLVLDEIRLLHTADIERSVLMFTLISRAVFLSMAPGLGSWSVARAPLATGAPLSGNVAWGTAALISLGTAFAAPRIVSLVLSRNSDGRRARRNLLVIEVPVAGSLLLLVPAWPVAVFSTGWTNWWQRQTPGNRFDWRKLVAFLFAVVSLQAAGLAIQRVSLGPATGEVLLTLTAIGLTGGTYGALLPLSVGMGLDVLVGDGRRSLRAVLRARRELLGAARRLAFTASEIEVAAPESPTARRAAATARQAARQLNHAADRAGRRAFVSSQVLVELASEAIARSYLPRRDSSVLLAASADQVAAPYATEPIYEPPSLLTARVTRQRDARSLRAIVERSLNEAKIHGTRGVRIIFVLEAGRLIVRIANRPQPATHGLSGQGGRELKRLSRRLPGGRLERGMRSPADIRMPSGQFWWVVEASCDANILDRSMEY